MELLMIPIKTSQAISKQIIHIASSIVLLSVLMACASLSESQDVTPQTDKIYTPDQLRSDLRYLDRSLHEIHPDVFSRIEKSDYRQTYDQLYSAFIWPQRRNDFYRQISPLVAGLNDIHTRVLYPSQERQEFLANHGEFPLAVLNTSEGLIVVADKQKVPVIPIGATILAINNISIETILNKFNHHIPKETQTGQRRMIQMEFASLLWRVYQFQDQYQIEYLWQNKRQASVVYGVKYMLAGATKKTVSHYGFIPINSETSLLWLNDFNEDYEKFDDFLKSNFKNLNSQKKKNLLIDLRYNQGGVTDNLALLLSYLTDRPINWASHASLKISEQFRQQHGELVTDAKRNKYGNYLDWLPVEWINLWAWEVLFSENGELIDARIKTVQSNEERHFSGNIIVLSNGYCYSACASLVATLKYNNLATVIGEMPGSQTKLQYGYPLEVELPHTGLKLVIPAMAFRLVEQSAKMDDTLTNSDLIDYKIERKRLDVLLGRDPVYEFALELLNRESD